MSLQPLKSLSTHRAGLFIEICVNFLKVSINVCFPPAGVRAGTACQLLPCVTVLHVHFHVLYHRWAHWALLGPDFVVPLLMSFQLIFPIKGLSTLGALEVMVGSEKVFPVHFVIGKIFTTTLMGLAMHVHIMTNQRAFHLKLHSRLPSAAQLAPGKFDCLTDNKLLSS